MSLFDLGGRHAVVLAGTSTLGSAMAAALAEHGARVAIVGRSHDKASEVARTIEQAGGAAMAFVADACQRDDLLRLLDEVRSWGGPVHTLLHCPGVNAKTPFFDISSEEWRDVLRVNLDSAVLAAQVFGRHMIDHGERGSIIYVSSASSGPPLSGVFTYSASKAALNSVTQSLAREFAPKGVRVNAILPGFFPAEQNRAILTDERVEAILTHTPAGRFGEPSELGGAAVWLASERASGFVTGALIRVDGGFSAMSI